MNAFPCGKCSADEGNPERTMANVFGGAGQGEAEEFAKRCLQNRQRHHDGHDGDG